MWKRKETKEVSEKNSEKKFYILKKKTKRMMEGMFGEIRIRKGNEGKFEVNRDGLY
jgi:hypothetical protein